MAGLGTVFGGEVSVQKGSGKPAKLTVGNKKLEENSNDPEDGIVVDLPKTELRIEYPLVKNAYALSASSTNSTFAVTNLNKALDDPYVPQVIMGTPNWTWLAANVTADGWIEFESPTIVLIGDSIPEGHPETHGRLHAIGIRGVDTDVDLDQDNYNGQIAYTMTEMLGCNVVNQALGGQTTQNVWDRWRRDVLAETYDAGDGRVTKTLNKKPHAVIIMVGINDVSVGASVDGVKERLDLMAQSAIDNNMYAIFTTMYPDPPMNAAKRARALEINEYMLNELSKKAQVIDVYKFVTGGSTSWAIRTDFAFLADSIHPNTVGRAAIAQYVIDNIEAPIFLKSIAIETNIATTMTAVTRPKDVTFSSGTYSKDLVFENRQVNLIENLVCRGYKQRLTMATVHEAKSYWGVSAIKGIFGYR